MKTLLQLQQSLEAFEQWLDELPPDKLNDPETIEEIHTFYDSFEEDFSKKVGGYVRMIREFELRAKAIKEEADRLAAKARSADKKAKCLRERLKEALANVGVHSVRTPYGESVTLKDGPPKVEIIDESDIPSKYLIYSIAPDKSLIKNALQSGVELGFARLVSEKVLQIR